MRYLKLVVGLWLGFIGFSSEAAPVIAVQSGHTDRRLFDYYFQQALKLKFQNDYASSFELFLYCTQLDSLDPQPWYELASYYQTMENKDQTRQMLEKAHRLNPKDEWYAFALANVYMADKHINEAIQLYEGLIRHRPDNENLLFQLAALYGNTGGFKKAIETLDQVERLIGKNEQVSLEKYKYYKALGKPAKAIREIEALSESLPYDVDTRILLGDAWMDLGKPDKAYAIYMEAKQMDPENPSIYLSLADYYTEMGDTATASKQLHLALTNPNTDVTTKLNILTPIMTSSLKSGDSLTVDKYFAMLLEQHPNEYQIRDLYVQWLLQTNRKVEAKQELRTVLDLNPTNLKAWRNYLELNLEYDKQDDIRRICQEALTYFPKEPIFWFYLGLSWTSEMEQRAVDKDKCLKAIEAFDQAIIVADSSDKGFVSRLYGITGDTYLMMGDTVKAFSFYDKALEVFPGNLLVLNNYAYFLALKGTDLDRAERMSRKTIEADPTNTTFLDTFAWIFFKQGQYGLAKIYIERAVANSEEPNKEILEHYGDILWFNKEYDEARQQWKKAAQLENPSESLLKKVEVGSYYP